MRDISEAKKIWRLGIEKYFFLLQGTIDKHALEVLDEEWHLALGHKG
jgi:hypothetical protein